MFPRYQRKLADCLCQALHLNKSRADCFSAAALAAIESKSVLLSEIAARLPGAALPESKFRRLQYFFAEVRFDYNALTRFLMVLMKDVLGSDPVVLAMDRTNWEARGNNVNLLVLSACLGDAGQPLLWSDLRHPGNSDTRKRIRLVRRFLKLYGRERIKCVVGDREFVGEDWFGWLLAENIPFVLRLRENMKVAPASGPRLDAKGHFTTLRPGEFRDLEFCRICGVTMGVCGLRMKSGESLILGYWGMNGDQARDMYMKRWNIETGFEKLKSHGFHLEASRLRGGGKQERLLAILAVGFAWCYAMGLWSIREIRPIRFIRKIGRKGRSIFGRGLEILAGLLHRSCPALRRVAYKALALLRDACLDTT
jgi:hypothetical protein